MSDLARPLLVALLIFLTYSLAVWLHRPNRRTYR